MNQKHVSGDVWVDAVEAWEQWFRDRCCCSFADFFGLIKRSSVSHCNCFTGLSAKICSKSSASLGLPTGACHLAKELWLALLATIVALGKCPWGFLTTCYCLGLPVLWLLFSKRAGSRSTIGSEMQSEVWFSVAQWSKHQSRHTGRGG